MNLSEERAARNESLFREVNEQVEELTAPGSGVGMFVCECSDTDCMERVRVPIEVYETVRQHGRRFLVRPGHEGGFERVVEEADGYVIVEKEGDAGRLADRSDPRA